MTNDLWKKGAIELAADIADRTVSSREVVQAHLDRIAEVNPHVNAIVRVLADDALRMADDADKAVKSGVELGPLLALAVMHVRAVLVFKIGRGVALDLGV